MPQRFLKLPEVKARVALSRASIYAKMGDGHFPLSVSLGARSVAWRETDIEIWMDARRPAAAEHHASSDKALEATLAVHRPVTTSGGAKTRSDAFTGAQSVTSRFDALRKGRR